MKGFPEEIENHEAQKETVVRCKNTQRLTLVILFLLVIDLCVTGCVVFYLFKSRNQESSAAAFSAGEQTTRYTLYIGTNDKDTYTQLISLEDAKEIVNEICTRYVDAYTGMEALGTWMDETGILTEESTLVYTFTGVQEEDIISIMDEILEELNQNAILVEVSSPYSYYYYGE
ncbi:MAG: DUF3574 domain-containing protein [Lachnospiraceae bacterium]|nr:DUF3574 domain-containing protein [Lachnospiraceae bacterium]